MMYPGRVPRLCLVLLALTLAPPVAALEPTWPTEADQVLSRTNPVAGFRIATGAFDGRDLPTRPVDGTLTEEVWRLPGDGNTPARLVPLIRDQLRAQGYEIGFACADRACGGFDFRFALPIARGPEMHVDLGGFHYLTAQRNGASGPEDVAITLSQGGQAGYVHIAKIASGTAPSPVAAPDTPPSAPTGAGDLITRLMTEGRAVMDDLSFRSGASVLSDGPHQSLVALAAWLAEDPGRRVALVGHTDTSGSQDANAALSRARAEAVRRALVSDHDTRAEQVTAAGVGYLAPRATNGTPDGREVNRRVEVVLLSN